MRLINRAVQDGDADMGVTEGLAPKVFEPRDFFDVCNTGRRVQAVYNAPPPLRNRPRPRVMDESIKHHTKSLKGGATLLTNDQRPKTKDE